MCKTGNNPLNYFSKKCFSKLLTLVNRLFFCFTPFVYFNVYLTNWTRLSSSETVLDVFTSVICGFLTELNQIVTSCTELCATSTWHRPTNIWLIIKTRQSSSETCCRLQKYKHKVKHDQWPGEVPIPWAPVLLSVDRCSKVLLQSEEDSRSTRDLQASSASPPSSGWNKSWHKCCYRICPWKLLEKQEIPLRFQTQSSKSPNSLKSRASKKNTTTSSSSPPHFLPRWRRAARYRPLPDGRTDSSDRQTRSSVCF